MPNNKRGPARVCAMVKQMLCCLLLTAAPVALAADADKREALERLVRYLQLDTTNPPGNETLGVEFFADIFAAAGIKYETAESAPGRGNIWARIEGGDEPALVLLNHIDVVSADQRHWRYPAFSGVVADGKVYGRGAIDMKGTAIIQLQAFLALARERKKLNRDLVFVAVADEEAGGHLGSRFLIDQHPEIFEGAGFLMNEGGNGSFIGARPVFSVGITQKTPLWLRVTVQGSPGHGSTPAVSTSVTRLLRALGRLSDSNLEPRALPVMRHYLGEVAGLYPPYYQQAFRNIDERVGDPEFMLRLQLQHTGLASRLRNTCSITRLGGGDKINVVPAEAWAELDCRLLPDEKRREFVEGLRVIMNEPALEFRQLLAFEPAVSPVDTQLFRAIDTVMKKAYPDALVLPYMVAGFTDSHWFRKLGLTAYGFTPILISSEDASGVHGNNERLDVAAFERGIDLMTDILRRFAVKQK